jgi:predicted HD phosphohydrolase
MSPVESVLQILSTAGAETPAGGSVSHLTHALRCATLAERAGATPQLIAAALVHDIGKLLDARTARKVAARPKDDAPHRGAQYLTRWFSPAVVEPVRLQTEADRLLCAVDMDYFVRLSADAIASLIRRGGPMNQLESSRFVDHPYADDAVRLRRWHQQAADSPQHPGDLPSFRRYLEVSLLVEFQVA